MPDIRKRKGYLYIVICMLLISFIHAVPVENPVTASRTTYRHIQTGKLPITQQETFDFYIATVEPEVSFEAMNANNISFGDTLVYRAPVEDETVSVGKAESSESKGHTRNSGRYHAFRFLMIVYAMCLLPSVIVHILLVLFGSSFIELWRDIYYIHRSDGKKGRRLSVTKR